MNDKNTARLEEIMQKHKEYGLDVVPFTSTQGATGIAMIKLENVSKAVMDGITFLHANKNKYRLRLIDNENTNYPQGLELGIAEPNGDFSPLFSLDMAGIFSQCAPLNIIDTINNRIQCSLQAGDYATNNNQSEIANLTPLIWSGTNIISEVINDSQFMYEPKEDTDFTNTETTPHPDDVPF